MERPRCVQGPRAARRSEWLRSALAHHHRPDPGAENEIVVLATGIDQYLQEVFHHLAHPNQEEAVSAADFGALCALLRLPEEEEEDGEFTGLRSDLPPQLSFRQFHSRLCGYFRARSSGDGRLPLTEDTELVQRQIRARWPRVRRRKCVTFELEQQRNSCQSSSGRTPKDSGDSEEVSALRELVEDLRSALQGSDARCLALEVALRRERAPAPPPPPPPLPTVSSPTSITFAQGKLVPTSRIKGGEVARRLGRRRDARDPLVRELKLIRSSRDGQLKEAIRFNQRLEEEVGWAYQEVRKLQALESALRRENTLIRRRAEEAREALSLGLQRVQLLQEQAQLVPQLQSRITQLETQVQQHRSCCICSHNPLVLDTREEELSCKSDGECLQRAVEGRAASDEEEEEEERGARDDAEVKKLDCSQGTLARQNRSAQLGSQTEGDTRGRCRWRSPAAPPPVSSTASGELRPQAQEHSARVRTHLSAVEEQFRDALTLLLQLRNKVRVQAARCRPLAAAQLQAARWRQLVVSCLQMDRVVVDVCRRSGDCPTLVLRVAESLCLHLTSERRVAERQEKGVGASSSGRQPGSVRALIASC